MRSDDAELTFTERARRAQLIDATVEILAEEGFANASLARIARHVEVSKGVVLYHFGSKEALMRQVLVESYTAAGEGVETAVVSAVEHQAKLAAYIRGNLAFIDNNRRHVRALSEILVHLRNADGQLVFDESDVDSVVAPLRTMLGDGQRDGEFRHFDTTVMARTIRAAIDVVVPRIGVDSEFDVAAYADHLVDLFEHATRLDRSTSRS